MVLGKRSQIGSTGSNISAHVTVGHFTSIGPYVHMHTLYNHACIENPRIVSTFQHDGFPPIKGHEDIIIGSDVWIGRNVTLLGGITIGDGAIIGAFSVVAKDIPPYAVVVGNPAQIKRYRFEEEQIKALLRIRWWLETDEKIAEMKDYMMDIDEFIKLYDII